MTLVRAKALAVRRVPGAGSMVFADGEDQVAFFGESAKASMSVSHGLAFQPYLIALLDLRERALVSL